MFGNDHALIDQVRAAGDAADEPPWPFPLERATDAAQFARRRHDEHGRPQRRAITAALFLEEFVDGIPWAHIDIAGTARERTSSRGAREAAPGLVPGCWPSLLLDFQRPADRGRRAPTAVRSGEEESDAAADATGEGFSSGCWTASTARCPTRPDVPLPDHRGDRALGDPRLAGVSVTEEIVVPDNVPVSPTTTRTRPPRSSIRTRYRRSIATTTTSRRVTIPIKSLLDAEGIRFIFTSFVPNFAGFGVVAVTFVALMGAGVAEGSGLMGALIRLLVRASPRRVLAFALIFVGVVSSVATDAGYLILVPLGAAAFASVGRHPLAGMAACFAGVGAIFGVNPITPATTPMITAITNEALGAARGTPLGILANYWFSIVSSIVLAFVAYVVTERIVEPRLGEWVPASTRVPPARRSRTRPTTSTIRHREARPPLRAGLLLSRSSASSCSSRSRPARRSATPTPATSSGRRRSWTACCSSSR